MAIQVYEGTTPLFTIRGVLNASMSDKLTGETSFSFSTLASKAVQLKNGQLVKQGKMIYRVVRVAKSLSGALPTVTAECEHVSYELNNEEYNLVTFVFEGTPTDGLTRILEGTPFSMGEVEETAAIACAFTEGTLTRRDTLMRFADACGCEVEYDEYTIHFRKHRGSRERIELMNGRNVTAVSSTEEAREGTTSFEVTLYKLVTLGAGDEVHIKFEPLSIDVETRIVGIEFDPFNPYVVRIEVGDYVPNILTSTSQQLDKIKQEFRAADGELESKIETAEGKVSILSQTVDGFDMRILTAEGHVSDLSQTVQGFDARILSAEGSVATLTLTVNTFDSRIKSVEGSTTQIEQLSNKISLVVTDKGAIDSASIITAINNDTSSITLSANKIDITAITADASDAAVDAVMDGLYLTATNGASSSTIKMYHDGTLIDSISVKITGMVTFSDLEEEGESVINGANIMTGTLTADAIGANNGAYITFNHGLALSSSYPDIMGVQGLYFGEYAHITKSDFTYKTALQIYSYQPVQFTGPHPVYMDGSDSYELLSTYNFEDYYSTTAVYG